MRVWRVYTQEQRLCPHFILRWILVWMSVCFLGFMVGPPRRLKENTSTQSQCAPCNCYCSSAEYVLNTSDCGKHDPVTNEEMNKDVLTMLSEELNLQKIVANETLGHTRRLVTNVKNTFSHYQMEAEKCNMAMETCEEARERAEAELIEERKLTALWENRAREYGWKDERRTRLS